MLLQTKNATQQIEGMASGDVLFKTGDGKAGSGSVELSTGASDTDSAGDITITAGNGTADSGAEVLLSSGDTGAIKGFGGSTRIHSGSGFRGGNVSFLSGDGKGSSGGDILLQVSSGSGTALVTLEAPLCWLLGVQLRIKLTVEK